MFRKFSFVAALFLALFSFSGCFYSVSHGVATGVYERVAYYGPHPVYDVNGTAEWCNIQGAHTHSYAPDSTDFYVVESGRYIFVGDPTYYVTNVNFDTYYYMGEHPLPFGNAWCYIEGPHRHYWAASGYYNYTTYGGYNYYTYYGERNAYYDPGHVHINLYTYYDAHPPVRFARGGGLSVGMSQPRPPMGGGRPGDMGGGRPGGNMGPGNGDMGGGRPGGNMGPGNGGRPDNNVGAPSNPSSGSRPATTVTGSRPDNNSTVGSRPSATVIGSRPDNNSTVGSRPLTNTSAGSRPSATTGSRPSATTITTSRPSNSSIGSRPSATTPSRPSANTSTGSRPSAVSIPRPSSSSGSRPSAGGRVSNASGKSSYMEDEEEDNGRGSSRGARSGGGRPSAVGGRGSSRGSRGR